MIFRLFSDGRMVGWLVGWFSFFGEQTQKSNYSTKSKSQMVIFNCKSSGFKFRRGVDLNKTTLNLKHSAMPRDSQSVTSTVCGVIAVAFLRKINTLTRLQDDRKRVN